METELLTIGFLPLVVLTLAAVFAGIIDSMAGGGGLITLPTALLVGLPPHIALGTGKFMAAIGTTASFFTYARGKAILWRVLAQGVLFSFLGSAAGAQTALLMDPAILGKVILALLPLAAFLTFFPLRPSAVKTPVSKTRMCILTPLVCLVGGFYDGFFGPASGCVLLLGLHCCIKADLLASSATAKPLTLASSASGLIFFLLSGNVYFYAAIPMAAGHMAGSIIGSRLALRYGSGLIRRVLLFSLGLLFCSLAWRYI